MFYNLLTDAEYNGGALWAGAAAILAVILLIAVFCDNNKYALDTKCIAMAGISIALSFVLSFIKLFSMPQGGSVTLASLLPVLIFSYIYGTKKGVFVGVILGLLNLVQDMWIVHAGQVLLDYPLAFGAIGLAGMFGKIKIFDKYKQIGFALGTIAALSIRFVSHVISGVFAFYVNANNIDIWLYSLGYNSFVFIDGAISLVLGVILFSSPAFIKAIFPKTVSEKSSEKAPEQASEANDTPKSSAEEK